MKEHDKIDELRWVRVFTPIHIPTYLVEQVRDRDFTVDDFYKFQERACIRVTKDGQGLNPLNHLYVLSNKENLTKGFLWFTVDSLSKDISINTFSMDKDYWFKGKAVEKVADFVKEIRRKANLNKVYWITNYPKHSERHGFKRSKSVLMEFTEEQDGKNIHGGGDTGREHRPFDPSTTTNPGTDIGAAGAGTASRTIVQPVLTAV